MHCFSPDCSRSAPEHTLYRVNAKGRPGIWACAAHRLEKDKTLGVIVRAVEAGQVPPDAQVIGDKHD